MVEGCTLTVGGEQGRVVVVVDGTVVVVDVLVDDVLVDEVIVVDVLVDVVVDGGGALTRTAGEVPFTAEFAVAVTVTVWLPAVWNVTPGENVWRPLSPATKV
jgi:hypothetical protein